MSALLEAKHVTRVYGGGLFSRRRTVALENFSLAIDNHPPSITALVGESGSGKTTAARLLLGLTRPTRGQVLYEGKDIWAMARAEWRTFRRDVQVIFQDPYEVYNPFYRVDHVLETPVAKYRLAETRPAARLLIEETLHAVGLRPEETLGRYPHQLSGGQRQRLMVARAMLLKPRLIVADEPVSMVDASLRATILDSLRKLTRELNVSVVYITHDLTTAYQISQNIIVLYRGGVAEVGDVERVVKHPQHPYTQLLVSSIPRPDPDHTWDLEQGASEVGRQADTSRACRFADRCPHAMAVCLEQRPPLFKSEAHRAAACYLYREAPSIRDEQMGDVFVQPAHPGR